MEELKAAVDVLARPPVLCSVAAVALLLAVRSRLPWTAAGGGGVAVLAAGGLGLALTDPVFLGRALVPSRLPVLALAVLAAVLVWQAVHRSHRTVAGSPAAWGGFSTAEWTLGCAAILAVAAVSRVLEIPLDVAADPTAPPDGSRAPWLLLPFEELGRFSDTPAARIVLPALALLTLVALPFVDRAGHDGNGGVNDFEDRRGVLTLGLFAIVWLMVLPMLIGAFLRGPHGLAYGPFAVWDADRPHLSATMPLSELIWGRLLDRSPRQILVRELPGLVFLVLYLGLLPWQLPRWKPTRAVFGRHLRYQGRLRFHLGVTIALLMLLVPIKMYGRWLFGVDCLVHLQEWSFHL